MLKLSGEALAGDTVAPGKPANSADSGDSFGIHPATMEHYADEIASVASTGVEVCVTIGGGNIFRGVLGEKLGVERVTADHMGMLATLINALALQSTLEGKQVFTRVISALPIQAVCEPYIRRRSLRHLEKKRVVIFAAGTGNPYFSTDSAAALRASEMNCDVLMKATKVDGIYSADPHRSTDAVRFDRLSYQEVLIRDLRVMDASAITLARDNRIPIIVFSLHTPGGFAAAVRGEGQFTRVDHQTPDDAPA